MSNFDMKLPNILVTGTPGVGKTSLAMLLVENLNDELKSDKSFVYINLGKLIKDKKLYDTWNDEYDVPEFDEDKILEELEPLMIEGGYVIDFHSVYFFPEDLVNLVVLLRCDNTILYDRLKSRGYNEKKIKENIECEIMEVTSDDVRDNFPESKIIELRNEYNESIVNNIEQIIQFIKSN